VSQAIVTRRRRWILIAVAVIALAIIALNVLSGFYIDLLWFREVGKSSVFWTIFWSKVVLGVLFGVVFFALLYANLLIVRRLVPPYRTFTPEQEVVERYRVAIEPYAKWILPALSLVIALFVGIGASGQWQPFQLWRNSGGVAFGSTDPVYHRDISFYVFKLPFLHFVQGWLFSALVGITVVVAVAHYLWGGIRLQGTAERVTPQVKAHLSVLFGLIVLVKAWGYYLGRYDLLFSTRGVVQGASYTDLHAQKLALFVLLWVAVICAVVFFVNIRFRGWAAPAVALGLLLVVAVVVGAIIPAAVQRLSVAPQELQREAPYIHRNIQATRAAFGLDTITSTDSNPSPDITQQDITQNSATVQNIRLWQPVPLLKDDYDALQRIRKYYEFQDVDVDRYQVANDQRLVMISTREVSQNGIPGSGGTWQNRHLVYTHGFGTVASQVNTSTVQGEPAFLLQDIPPVVTSDQASDLSVSQPRVYYGEREDVPFVVVNTSAGELDYQSDSQQKQAPPYTGTGGIKLGGFFGKLLFAWRFKDVNLLISGLIHNDSRVMIFRKLQERIPKAAPFLQYDSDPYTAVVDGRIVWIQDAYTTTNMYPYSQSVRLSSLAANLSGTANYIRNSVKVVMDAYTGQMTYYVVDPTDPLIKVWENVFPNLFTPVSQASPALRAHFRYPEDLFTVQANQFANYHVQDSRVFYGKQDFWALPLDPTAEGNVKPPLRPYYLQMLLPGHTSEEFVLILPFTPSGRNNMIAWMAAPSDPADYGKLVSFEFPSGTNVDGPLQVFGQINSDPTFSEQRTLLSRGGSKLLFGDFLVIPLDRGFLYVLPVFVQGNQTGAFPELKRVVVVHGGTVGVGATLTEALDNSFGNVTPPPPPGGGGGGGSVSDQIKRLLADAVRHFQAADQALRNGDLATYQKEIAAAQADIQQAQQLANQGPSPTPTPSGTASPTPSPSAT
jgi:uncharacterized protein